MSCAIKIMKNQPKKRALSLLGKNHKFQSLKSLNEGLMCYLDQVYCSMIHVASNTEDLEQLSFLK
jgi:hypothetical protein